MQWECGDEPDTLLCTWTCMYKELRMIFITASPGALNAFEVTQSLGATLIQYYRYVSLVIVIFRLGLASLTEEIPTHSLAKIVAHTFCFLRLLDGVEWH